MARKLAWPSIALISPLLAMAACDDDDGYLDGAAGSSIGGSGIGNGGSSPVGGSAMSDAGEQGAGEAGMAGEGGAVNVGASGSGGVSGRGGATGGSSGTAGSSGIKASSGSGGNGGASGSGGSGGGGGPGLVGDTFALTSAGRLVLFKRSSGAIERSVAITGLAAGENIVGMDVRPANKKLYALASSGKLYTVDTATGIATLAATLAADPTDTTDVFTALAGSAVGVDFNPVADRLRVVTSATQNLCINVDTGATITDTPLTPGAPLVTAAAYTNSFASACRTALYVVDTSTARLLIQNPPNDGVLTAVGDLGLSNVGAGNGFDIATSAAGVNEAFALLTVGGVTSVYDIDLARGTASNPRALALNTGETLRGMSALTPATDPAQARGELAAVSVGNRLVSFERSAPGKLCTSFPISGLAVNEGVLGIDSRPADGALYALGKTGKLYTLDPSTGAATLRSTLLADPTDTTDVFTALAGNDFGVGFNPVPDRLRVVSNTGQNLRINVDTGAVTTDATLAPAMPSVTAVAYSNGFAGARSTTLFGLGNGTLVRIGGDPATGGACPADVTNPNCGIVTSINTLGLVGVPSTVDAFDIDPRTGTAGAALAALSVGTATTSSLYTIDLATGTAAAPAGVANTVIGGGERIIGLALLANPTVTAWGIAGGRLVGFSLATPGTFSSDLAITGLQANESIIGIDFRPVDGLLYALGSSGRLYTLDTTTGAATQLAVLTAAVGDDNPFVALKTGANYGLDFNPAADLLRAASDGRDNLRIVPSTRVVSVGQVTGSQVTGATITDADLNPGTPNVVGAAYTNNFGGAATTTLFAIDTVTNELVRQGGPDSIPSPNGGLVTTVGSLPLDPMGDVGFDIIGGRNGLALAAMRTTGTSSELYVVNLATGAATAFNTGANTVGTAGTTPALRGLALQLR